MKKIIDLRLTAYGLQLTAYSLLVVSCLLLAVSLLGCGSVNTPSESEKGNITGTVTAYTAGTAIASATISAAKSGGTATTTTTAQDGTYSFSNLDVGTYTVSVSKASYNSSSESVSVTSGQTTTKNFRLTTVAETSGTLEVLVKENGAATANVSVLISTSSSSDPILATTEASGYAYFRLKPAGTYSIFAIKNPIQADAADNVFGTGEATIAVNSTATKEISISTKTPTYLTVLTKDDTDAVVSAANVLITEEVGSVRLPFEFLGVTDATGVVTFEFSSGGLFNITAYKGTQSGSGQISIAQGQADSKTITMSGGTPVGSFTVTSTSIASGAISIECASTYKGGGNKSIQLSWTGTPSATSSLALLMSDNVANNFVHWAVIDIPSTTATLAKDASKHSMPSGCTELDTLAGNGYFGPEPGEPTTEAYAHTYKTQIFALNIANVSGMPAEPTYDQFISTIGSNIISVATLEAAYWAVTWTGTVSDICNACHSKTYTQAKAKSDAVSHVQTKTGDTTKAAKVQKWINDAYPQP